VSEDGFEQSFRQLFRWHEISEGFQADTERLMHQAKMFAFESLYLEAVVQSSDEL
jgi:hypothetical protein